jgi:hypothetical protein
MRNISATAVLLVLAFSMLPPACVAGWNDGTGFELSASNCEEMPQLSGGRILSRHHGLRAAPSHEARVASQGPTRAEIVQAAEPCGDAFKSRPGHCRLRSFIQLHFANFQTAEVSVPLLAVTRGAPPLRVIIVVSSVGPPETDRGPPRS